MPGSTTNPLGVARTAVSMALEVMRAGGPASEIEEAVRLADANLARAAKLLGSLQSVTAAEATLDDATIRV